MSGSSQADQMPEWVRRRDGSRVPFEADRLCQSLFAASEALGTPNAFLARELTDVAIHFLAQEFVATVPRTEEIAAHVAKIVREVGHPALARHYAQAQAKAENGAMSRTGGDTFAVAFQAADTAESLVKRCMEAYSLQRVFSSDLRGAAAEGLLHLSDLTAPDKLTSFVANAQALGDDSWWLSWTQWQACGALWVVDSPEWLAILLGDRLPIVRLCERIIALPRVSNHAVELHLNVGEPPSWIRSQGIGPLFAGEDNPFSVSHRFGFLDMLLEQSLSIREEYAPALAWHVHEESFRDPAQLARLKMLVRHAVLGRSVRFVFDRPTTRIALSEGINRESPGVLLEVGLNLALFARRPEIARNGDSLLKKLPSLARMAVSAAAQKRNYLRNLSGRSPLKQEFLIDRSACVVIPGGLETVVRAVTGQIMTRSPLSLEFALQILQMLKSALVQAGRAINLEMRLDSPSLANFPSRKEEGPSRNGLSSADDSLQPKQQLTAAGKLHACAGSGTTVLSIVDEADAKVDSLVKLLHWTWQETSVVRLRLKRASERVEQGEFAI